MLVLSRKCGQKIIIAGNIEIIVVDIFRDKVRIGITAPKEIRIDRKEVSERIKNGKD